ncbi:MAG: hypothetical protein M3R13_05245 [Armatimonadota bacterium]|nr:hypothetical protein [Armatimonadota bacterium]
MSAEEAVAKIEAVAKKLREAADDLAAASGPIGSALAAATKTEADLRDAAKKTEASLEKAIEKSQSELKDTGHALASAEKSLASAQSSLSKIEGSIMEMIDAATHALHDPEVPLKGRQRMLGLAKVVFAQLKGSGFEVIIPEIGVGVDQSRHSVKGRSKSHLDGTHVADVVSWGYKFPSGAGKSAEVLVGDASLAPVAEEPLPEEPSEKAGIKMIVEEDTAPPKEKKQKAKKAPETMFEILAEAAEKNTPP